MMRLTTSLALPPANGMITVMARVGYACACATPGTPASAATMPNASMIFPWFMACSLLLRLQPHFLDQVEPLIHLGPDEAPKLIRRWRRQGGALLAHPRRHG